MADATAQADVSALRAGSERRAAQRLAPEGLAEIVQNAGAAKEEQHFYLPPRSRPMAVSLLVALGLAAAVSPALPGWPSLIAGLLSTGLFAVGGWFAAIERRCQTRRPMRFALLILANILPMACVGYALGAAIASGLPWEWAVATLVCINAAAAVLFSGRIASLFCANIASWAGFVVIAAPGLLTFAALTGAAVTLALIAQIEWRAAERRRALHEARERIAARAEDILRSFEESGQGWFWETDRLGLITYISPKVARVLGRSPESLRGAPLRELFTTDADGAEAARALAFHLSARSQFQDLEMRAGCPDEERWWALTGRPVYDSYKNFCGFRGHGTDLTERRRSEQQVSRLALYDSLTGLANRVQMSQALEQILAAPAKRERACAVLMLDLDRFKQVNDTLGHPAGDALLQQVAQRLEQVIGTDGRCGRLGGDEFKVIIPGERSPEELAAIAQEIIALLSQPYMIGGQSVVIGVSIGIARAPSDGSTSEALIRSVDLALYAAKDAGRGVARFYEPGMHAAVEERAALEQDLRAAITRGELKLWYQPVVYAASEKVVGFEALMRWDHPQRGCVSPTKFVPIAEDAGLIDRLGQWALQSACADLARWPANIRCSINVSALQFANPELPTIVASALAHNGIDPARLELEITESVFVSDTPGIEATFRALKQLGVRLALDDFGTGYSSLGYLRKAPFDRIKIDRSFVRSATEQGSRNGAIIAAITSLAEVLHMDTTAEGVETRDELELVRLLGCSHVQGHIYFPPMSAKDAAALVAGGLDAVANGPQSARAPRYAVLRKVVVVHRGVRHNATLRNISEGGAMIEGLWNVAEGHVLRVEFSPSQAITGQVRWSQENRLGVEFHLPLRRCGNGGFALPRGTGARIANLG
ncbi:EAL domain-containing protein [Erythrobacter tepidarius]|uniref:EAL domain-containing protein n=1 Tax=Erythrobacter tepidarius TaxID=60454 RepID=UPI001FEC4B80|nr:EAL domain-containing protein [Erythrobacter tepidarius]